MVLGEPKPPPPKDKPAPGPKKEPPLEFKPILGTIPYDFQIRLTQTKPEKKNLQTLTLKHILSPLQYVRLVSSKYDGRRQELTVELEATPAFTGPRCPVELVLPGDRFLPPGKDQDYFLQGTLAGPGDTVTLYMKGVRPRTTGGRDIDIYVNVDGYARAFVIRQPFAGQGGAGQVNSAPAVRLVAPPLVQSGKPLPVRFEVDYAAEQGENVPDIDHVALEFRVFRDDSRKQILFGKNKEGQFPAGPRSQQSVLRPPGAGRGPGFQNGSS